MINNLQGTSENTYSIGIGGPKIKNSSGRLEFRNSTDSAYINISAKDPIDAQDVATKNYLSTEGGNSAVLRWSVMGQITNNINEADGFRMVPFDCTIIACYMSLGQRGRNGNCEIEFHYGSPTLTNPGDIVYNTSYVPELWTTEANRPSIPGDNTNQTQNAILYCYNPDVTSLTKGQVLIMHVHETTSQPKDLTFQIFLKRT